MPLTYFLAELMGLFCLVFGLSVITQKKVFVEVVREIENNRPYLYLLGLISLVLGLLVVLTHNIWTGSFLALVVTLIGWAMLIRGIFALFVSHHDIVKFIRFAKIEKFHWLYGFIVLVIGLYLTYSSLVG
jgi:hypothetical protein